MNTHPTPEHEQAQPSRATVTLRIPAGLTPDAFTDRLRLAASQHGDGLPIRTQDTASEIAERASAKLAAGGLLRLPEVLALLPVAPSTWWAGVKCGRFPPGVKVSSRCTAWRAADIDALLLGCTDWSGGDA